MIAANKNGGREEDDENESENEPQKNGGSGADSAVKEMVSDGVDGVRTTRMLERAARQRWPIPEEFKDAIVKRQVAIAINKNSSAREASIAAKCVLEMERQNQADEHKQLDKTTPDQHAHTINVNQICDELLENAEFLEYQRTRAVQADAARLCTDGESG